MPLEDHPSDKRLVALLERCSSEDLEPLYELLTTRAFGRPGNNRQLADSLRRYGSNTFATYGARRGRGVHYLQVVRDVGRVVRAAPPAATDDEREWEVSILQKIVEKYLRGASPADREKIEELIRDAVGSAGLDARTLASSGALISMLLATVGRRTTQQIVTWILKRAFSRQVKKRVLQLLGRTTGLGIPGLNIIMSAWFVVDIAGPAYRKTLPAVIRIALLRLGKGAEDGE